MTYTDTEKRLIALAESWRSSHNFQSTGRTDNTPFQDLDGYRARAILTERGWEFMAVIRRFNSGGNQPTLQQSLEKARLNYAIWLDDMRKAMQGPTLLAITPDQSIHLPPKTER